MAKGGGWVMGDRAHSHVTQTHSHTHTHTHTRTYTHTLSLSLSLSVLCQMLSPSLSFTLPLHREMDIHTFKLPGFDKKHPIQVQITFSNAKYLDRHYHKTPNEDVSVCVCGWVWVWVGVGVGVGCMCACLCLCVRETAVCF